MTTKHGGGLSFGEFDPNPLFHNNTNSGSVVDTMYKVLLLWLVCPMWIILPIEDEYWYLRFKKILNSRGGFVQFCEILLMKTGEHYSWFLGGSEVPPSEGQCPLLPISPLLQNSKRHSPLLMMHRGEENYKYKIPGPFGYNLVSKKCDPSWLEKILKYTLLKCLKHV